MDASPTIVFNFVKDIPKDESTVQNTEADQRVE